MGDTTSKGQYIQNQTACFGHTSQTNQPDSAINSEASADFLSFTNQTSQTVQMSQIGQPGLINQIHQGGEPSEEDAQQQIPAEQIQLVTAVLKPAQPSYDVNVQGYTQAQPSLPAHAQALYQTEQPLVEDPSEECQVVLEVHKPGPSSLQGHPPPRSILPKGAQVIPQGGETTSASMPQFLQTSQSTSSILPCKTFGQSIAQGARTITKQWNEQGMKRSTSSLFWILRRRQWEVATR